MISPTETTITATFKNGQTATRRTRAAYFWAVKRNVGTQAGRGATITFHRTEEQARGIAGKRGEVVRTDYSVAAAGTCVVCGGARTVTYGPSAVDGTYSTVPCHRCAA